MSDKDRQYIIRNSGERQSIGPRKVALQRVPKPVGVFGNSLMEKRGSMVRYGAADNALNSPEVRNPLLNIINFFLPYNYRVLNQWIRYYDKFHPMVGNCLDLHGSFPISKFDLKFDLGCEDPKVRRIYENCVEEIDLFNRLLEISREYELLGEVFPYTHWNDELGFFDSLIIMNPDFIHVDMHPLAFGKNPIIKLEPDELLKVIATSNNPEDIEIRQEMDPMVIAAVLTQQNIRLDPFSVTQIARKSSPYEPRGTSIVLRCLKDLMYEDKLREAQYAIADGMVTPKTIWKLGDPANDYMPNEQELHDFRMLLQAQAHDPLSAIITHHGLEVDYVGYTGKILPVVPEFQFVEDRILTALYTNKALTHGEGPTYANASIAMEALQGRYLAKREKLEEFVKKKIFTKIAIQNGFFKPLPQAATNGTGPYIGRSHSEKDRQPNVPSLEWKQKLQLVEDTGKKQMIIALRNTVGYGVPGVSLKRIHEMLGISHDEEMKTLKEEGKVIKELQAAYGVGSIVATPGAGGSAKPEAPKKPGQLGLPGMDKDQKQNKPYTKESPRQMGDVQEPAQNTMKTMEPKLPTASLKRREGEWKLRSIQEAAAKGKKPGTAQLPERFFGETGKLADFREILDKTEKEAISLSL